MNANLYLDRIGLKNLEIKPTLEHLKLLQRQHLLHIPFENLDIHWNKPIVLDVEQFYRKIVQSGRGGFCYELNGLFYELLALLGFQSRIISSCVSDENDGVGVEYDHLSILTEVAGEGTFLVDVGFCNFIAEPLRFVLDIEQFDQTGTYIFRKYDDQYFEIAKQNAEKKWQSEYIFMDVGRDLAEFAEMCDFQQFSPESHFIKGKLCSQMTENGRKTLTDKKFIQTIDGTRSETQITSPEEFDQILEREFNITAE